MSTVSPACNNTLPLNKDYIYTWTHNSCPQLIFYMQSLSSSLHSHNSYPQLIFYGKFVPLSTCTQLLPTTPVYGKFVPLSTWTHNSCPQLIVHGKFVPLSIWTTSVHSSYSMVSLSPSLHAHNSCPNTISMLSKSPSVNAHNSSTQLILYGKFVPLSTCTQFLSTYHILC